MDPPADLQEASAYFTASFNNFAKLLRTIEALGDGEPANSLPELQEIWQNFAPDPQYWSTHLHLTEEFRSIIQDTRDLVERIENEHGSLAGFHDRWQREELELPDGVNVDIFAGHAHQLSLNWSLVDLRIKSASTVELRETQVRRRVVEMHVMCAVLRLSSLLSDSTPKPARG